MIILIFSFFFFFFSLILAKTNEVRNHRETERSERVKRESGKTFLRQGKERREEKEEEDERKDVVISFFNMFSLVQYQMKFDISD